MMKKIIVTVFISSLASVFLGNFLVMTYNVFYYEKLTPDNKRQFAVTKAGLTWDSRKAGQVLLDLRNAGVNAVPNYTPIGTRDHFKELDYQALGGRSFSTVVLCNEIGSWLTYTSDRFGFNNDDSIHDDPNVDVALIGDSYAQGYCVSRENTIAGQLNKNGFPTVNFGMGGNGFLSNLATVMEYVRPQKIKTTILVWYHNDLEDTKREYQYANLRHYLDNKESKLLKSRQNQIDDTLDELMNLNPYQNKKVDEAPIRFNDWSINWQAYFRGLLTLTGIRNMIPSAFDFKFRSSAKANSSAKAKKNNAIDSSFQVMQKALNRIVETAGSWGGRVIVVVLTRGGGNSSQMKRQISEMKEYFKEKNNLLISDFEPVHKKYGKMKLLALSMDGSHFNEYGYCLFAKHIAMLLESYEKKNIDKSKAHFDDCKAKLWHTSTD